MSATCHGCGAPLPPNKRRGTPRKWCSERCRKASYGDPCVECGARTVYGAESRRVPAPRCGSCASNAQHDAAVRRYERIAALRARGFLNPEIAERLDTTPAAIANAVHYARDHGIEIPHTPYGPSAARAMR